MPWTFWCDLFFLWYFGLINVFYIFVLMLGVFRTYFRNKELNIEDFTRILHSDSLPEICFLVPMYNEQDNILRTMHSILNLTYRYKSIILANDGSTDRSMELLTQEFQLIPIPKYYSDVIPTAAVHAVYRSKTHPNITVLDKAHSTKFDTLNAALNACSNPFFIIADADSYIDDRYFEPLIRPLLFDADTVGIGATIRIRNGSTFQYNTIDTKGFPNNYCSAMQGAEYLRSFLMRQGWENIGGNFLIAGAFSVFSTSLIKQIGGFANTVAEDVEIVLRIHRIMLERNLPYKIVYLPDPVSWTEGPNTLRALGRQRRRWHLGFLESTWVHLSVYFRPKYGLFGSLIFPFMVWGEALAPIIETAGYFYILSTWLLHSLNFPFFFLFLILSIGFTTFYSILCLLIEELSFNTYRSPRTIFLLLLSCCIENFGYRQLNLVWKLWAFVLFIKKFPAIRKESKRIQQLVKTAKIERPLDSSRDREALAYNSDR